MYIVLHEKRINPNKAGLFEDSFSWGKNYLESEKNADIIYYKLTLLVSLQQGNVKKSEKLVKIEN